MSTVRHGTYAGWNWHQRAGVPVCLDCKEAQRQYRAKWRADPENRAKDRAIIRAYHRALQRLAAEHPDQFKALVAEERAKIKTGERR
jgi:uncharacterized protein